MNFKGEYKGLSQRQVEKNITLYGINSDYAAERKRDSFSFLKMFLNPLFIFLALASVFYALDGTMHLSVICMILAVICAAFDAYRIIYLEGLLNSVTSSMENSYRVVRDENIVLVSKDELVPDDILIIQGGENIPADAFLLEVRGLTVDEGIFTGDNQPIEKTVGIDNENELKRTMIYSSTRAVSGSAICRITATGMDTKRYMQYGALPTPAKYTPVTEQIARKSGVIISFVAALGFAISLALLLAKGMSLPSAGEIACITALVFSPIKISSIIRTYYILGAISLFKKQAVVKSLETIDNLNSMSMLCVNKAGGIIKLKSEIQDIHAKNHELLINVASLSCDMTSQNNVEQAVKIYTTFQNADTSEEFNNERLCAYPFSAESRISGNLWLVKGTRLLCIKGAPETIFPLCDFEGNDLFEAQQSYSNAAKDGLSVIAVAFTKLDTDDIPKSLFGRRYLYAGLLSFKNEVKESVPFAIRQCQKAGVKVAMLTGDSADTAAFIGNIIGIKTQRVITGYDIESAEKNNETLDLREVEIFARITPSQKIKLIAMLKSRGEKIAVIGKDVSDALYLQNADVAISSLSSSTGAALDASNLLLNDDNLLKVSDTIKESRIIHFNIKRSVSLVISLILAMAFAVILPWSLGFEPVFSVITTGVLQALFVPLVVLSYGFLKYDSKLEISTSKYIRSKTVNKRFLAKAVLQGVVLGIGTALAYIISYKDNAAEARGLIFLMYVLSSVLLMWENQFSLATAFKGYPKKSTGSLIISSGIVLISMMISFTPKLAGIFGFSALGFSGFLVALGLSLVLTLWWGLVERKSKSKAI